MNSNPMIRLLLQKPPKKIMQFCLAICAAIIAVVAALIAISQRPAYVVTLIGIAVAIFSISAIPLFIFGLQDFKQNLRKAFVFICIGIALYSLSPLQFPAVSFFHLEALANTGIVVLPYIVAVSFIFWGVRRFGKVLQLRSFWFSPIWAFVAASVIAVLVGFLPHVHTDIPPAAFATVNGLNLWCGMILYFAVNGLLHVRKAAAARYHTALTWLIAGVSVNVFAAIHFTAVNLMIPADNWYAVYSPQIPALIGAFLFIRAGYAFTQVKTNDAALQTNASPVEVLIYVASLASNPSQIDTSLDRLREITSKLSGNNAALTPEQEASLAIAYTQIEKYLVTSEPLQSFTRQGLREIIRAKFQFKTGTKSPFWNMFAEAESPKV